MHLPPLAYRLWQRFFVAQKLRPLLEHPSFENAASVCELGCGPGANFPFLSSRHYVGYDIDRNYIRDATQRYGDHFRVADASAGGGAIAERFDIVLVHSVLHHLDDEEAVRMLTLARQLLADGGSLHVFDVVLPPWWTLAGVLARMDEGRHVREWPQWEAVFSKALGTSARQEFPLRLFGLRAYRMFHLVVQ